jgi:hypothetical protein
MKLRSIQHKRAPTARRQNATIVALNLAFIASYTPSGVY